MLSFILALLGDFVQQPSLLSQQLQKDQCSLVELQMRSFRISSACDEMMVCSILTCVVVGVVYDF